MILLMFFLIGGLTGLSVHYYLSQFSAQLRTTVYQNYIEIFPKNAPQFEPEYSNLKDIKCGAKSRYFFIFSLLFCIIAFFFSDWIFALLLAGSTALLFVTAKIDWHCQFILPEHCLGLTLIGLLLAYIEKEAQGLASSLQNVVLAFVFFWVIFQLAEWYKKDSFGRGDYWLIAALTSFHHWQKLPLMIFIACCSALIFVGLNRQQWAKKPLPFAPFLAFAHLFIVLLAQFD